MYSSALTVLATALSISLITAAPVAPPPEVAEQRSGLLERNTVFTYEDYGSVPVKREPAPVQPIVACEPGDNCPPWIVTREATPDPEPLRPMDPGNEYLACYWGYVGGKAKRDIDAVELEKRCGKAKRDVGDEISKRDPEPLTDLRNRYQACYSAYVSLKAKRGEAVESVELEKRCGKVKRNAEDEMSERDPEPLTDLRNMYRACYSAYVSQRARRGEAVESAELEKRCGKAKRYELEKRVFVEPEVIQEINDELGPTYQQSYAAYTIGGPGKVKREGEAESEEKAPIDDPSIVIGS
ncbi:uncharacterized protein AB675_10171 [Cyphellophora attinorum]|uniref:Uncharacterized protein n=1 Tax=Cyphellophora attinorum TaxID=1664694 RepID=A0A0N1HL50_9EURO|nr:uncharacterized protein AB675_10171 [Phialophora attinorum]KPI35160.1 hypothetical protein AB675_10171 [Phialophora attinorum]